MMKEKENNKNDGLKEEEEENVEEQGAAKKEMQMKEEKNVEEEKKEKKEEREEEEEEEEEKKEAEEAEEEEDEQVLNLDPSSVPQKEKVNLVNLQNVSSGTEAAIMMQRVLKKERQERLDEQFILKFDSQVLKEIQVLLDLFRQQNYLEVQRKNLLVQIESAFLQRISAEPFTVSITPETATKFRPPCIVKAKKELKRALTILHLHPCYFIHIHRHLCFDPDSPLPKPKSKVALQNDEFFKIVKEIYSYPTERSVYLMLSTAKGVLIRELEQHEFIEDVNFSSEQSAFGNLFRLILKSQETNMDSLCSFAGHVINKLIQKFNSDTQTSQKYNSTFDVRDNNYTKNIADFPDQKSNKGKDFPKRAAELFVFVEAIVKDLMENDVLCSPGGYFVLKKKYADKLAELVKEN